MNLKTKLENDLKVALKARDGASVSAIRMILAAIKNEELKDGKTLDDAGTIKILSTLAKQRRESIEAFEKGGRDDLAQKEKKELELIKQYLPEALTEEELSQIIDAAIAEVNATSPKDMGAVMKIVVPKSQGRADGKLVSEIVRRKLSH
jgi:uncharacterized protein YqeY